MKSSKVAFIAILSVAGAGYVLQMAHKRVPGLN
jgi:hypothetical protein